MTNKKKADTAYLDIAIPQNAENLQLPDPSLLQFYKNYENRIIWIDDEITTMTLEYAKMIMQWNFEDKQKNMKLKKNMMNLQMILNLEIVMVIVKVVMSTM